MTSGVATNLGGIADGQILANCGFERARAAMRAALDLFLGQCGKPSFDHVQPRRTGRREVHMKARMPSEPPSNPRRLVRPVVIENQMDVEFRGTWSSIVSRNRRNS